MSLKLTKRQGVYYLSGTLDGKRIRESLRTANQKQAEEKRAHLEGKLRRAALYGPESEATFGDACLLYSKLGRNDRCDYIPRILKAFGSLRLRDVTPVRVKELARRLYPNAKPQTWNRSVLVPVSAIIKHAHQHGLCPPIKIERFKAVNTKVKTPVTREWLEVFRSAAIKLYGDTESHLGQRLAAYALFMFTTAARPSEAIKLRPCDLDLEAREGKSNGITKNGEPRTFYLTEEMAEELRALPPTMIERGALRRQPRIFGWSDVHCPLGPWKAVCRAAGLAYRTPYEAGRHSYATEAVTRQGRNVATSAAVGGWKDPSIMLKHYTHIEKPGEFAEEVFGSKTKSDTNLTQR